MGWPKYLKKTYSKDELDRKVLKKLQLTHDREFLARLFVSEERDECHLKADLTKEEIHRLKGIVKEIKKGKGGIKLLPLIFLLILVGGGISFSLLFKNSLVDRMLENSLESLFGATVDAEGVNVSLVRLEVGWDSVAVTDSSDLESNLFEVGETVIKMNPLALLEKKVVMDSLICRGIAWGTYRNSPGELVPSPSADSLESDVKGASQGSKETKESGFFAPEKLQTEQTELVASAVTDPKSFVNEQWESLNTPALAEELEEKYRNELGERESSFKDIQNQSKSVVSEGQVFLKKDFNQYINNPAKIPELVEEGQSFYEKTDDVAGDVRRELKAIEDLRDSLKADKAALLKARDKDMARVKSLVTIPEGGVRGIVEGMVQSYLFSLLGDKYVKAQKIALFMKNYKDDGEKEAKDEPTRGRTGRIVPFDALLWPDLLLREGAFSTEGEGFSWNAGVNDVAARADQWGKAASVHLDWNIGSGQFAGDGVWERRRDSNDPSTGHFLYAGLPLSTDSLSGLGIDRAEGEAEGTAGLTIEQEGRWELISDLTIADPQLEKSGNDLVSNVVYSVLSAEDWNMTVFLSGEGSDYTFKLDWPLLEQVDDRIGDVLKEQANNFLEDVGNELTDRYASEMDFLEDYLGDLDDWEGLLKGDLSSFDNVENRVSDKIDDVKDEAASQAEEKAKELLEEAGVGDVADEAAKALNKFF
jgi:uncharacterized protein (TIGR03545 family)